MAVFFQSPSHVTDFPGKWLSHHPIFSCCGKMYFVIHLDYQINQLFSIFIMCFQLLHRVDVTEISLQETLSSLTGCNFWNKVAQKNKTQSIPIIVQIKRSMHQVCIIVAVVEGVYAMLLNIFETILMSVKECVNLSLINCNGV